jgi:hypothetical protein
MSPDAPATPPPEVSRVHQVIVKDAAGNELTILVNWVWEAGTDYKDIKNWTAHLSLNDTTQALPLSLFLKFLEEMKVVYDEAKRSGIIG